jgi:hypothetical protein
MNMPIKRKRAEKAHGLVFSILAQCGDLGALSGVSCHSEPSFSRWFESKRLKWLVQLEA